MDLGWSLGRLRNVALWLGIEKVAIGSTDPLLGGRIVTIILTDYCDASLAGSVSQCTDELLVFMLVSRCIFSRLLQMDILLEGRVLFETSSNPCN
jgi:hypothetical protein